VFEKKAVVSTPAAQAAAAATAATSSNPSAINLRNFRASSPRNNSAKDTDSGVAHLLQDPSSSSDRSDDGGRLLGLPRTHQQQQQQRRNSSSISINSGASSNVTIQPSELMLPKRKLSFAGTFTDSADINGLGINSTMSSPRLHDEQLDESYKMKSRTNQLTISTLNVSERMRQEDLVNSSSVASTPYGDLMLQMWHDDVDQQLILKVVKARGLIARDSNGFSDPYVKVYLLPGRE
jgi:hypothetical protein